MSPTLLSRRKALQFLSGAPLLPLGSAVSASTLLAACGGGDDNSAPPVPVAKNYVAATFVGMAAPTLAKPADMAARAAYDALSDQRKAQVSNYDVLLAAEKKLAQLQDEAVANVRPSLTPSASP